MNLLHTLRHPVRTTLTTLLTLVCFCSASLGWADTLYFVHTDHLGTPRVITDDSQQIVWEGSQAPFGEVATTTNTIEFNVRFPGQYYDQESGLHYNYFRDYDPTLGRYIQSDPIGLGGGLNTYGYVYQNPIRYTDLLGLAVGPCMEGAEINNIDCEPTIPGPQISTGGGSGTGNMGPIDHGTEGGELVKQCPPAKRANEIHSALNSRAQRSRTTAVIETKEGVRVVSSSERRLTPAQRAQLGANEVEGIGLGHAEVTGVNAARAMGLTPTGVAASRPICPSCVNSLRELGIDLLSILK